MFAQIFNRSKRAFGSLVTEKEANKNATTATPLIVIRFFTTRVKLMTFKTLWYTYREFRIEGHRKPQISNDIVSKLEFSGVLVADSGRGLGRLANMMLWSPFK